MSITMLKLVAVVAVMNVAVSFANPSISDSELDAREPETEGSELVEREPYIPSFLHLRLGLAAARLNPANDLSEKLDLRDEDDSSSLVSREPEPEPEPKRKRKAKKMGRKKNKKSKKPKKKSRKAKSSSRKNKWGHRRKKFCKGRKCRKLVRTRHRNGQRELSDFELNQLD